MLSIQRFLSGKKRLVRLCAACLSILTVAGGLSLAASARNTYVITDGDTVLVHTTYATDPTEVLSEAGLELGKDDTYTTLKDTITVNRRQTITVNYGGEALTSTTYGSTVSQILDGLGIPMSGNYRISQAPEAETFDGMVIDVTRVDYETLEYLRETPFETVYQEDLTLAPGEEVVRTAGEPGMVRRTAQVVLEDGAVASHDVTGEEVLTAPTTQVVARGMAMEDVADETARQAHEEAVNARMANTIVTASGQRLRYVSKLTVEATAYSCEGYTGITATGTVARVGAIAVDPDVIPYGTRMYIVSNDGSYIYGYATAEDCGGAIQGNRIDLYFDTVDECWQFGRRSCTVYILG